MAAGVRDSRFSRSTRSDTALTVRRRSCFSILNSHRKSLNPGKRKNGASERNSLRFPASDFELGCPSSAADANRDRTRSRCGAPTSTGDVSASDCRMPPTAQSTPARTRDAIYWQRDTCARCSGASVRGRECICVDHTTVTWRYKASWTRRIRLLALRATLDGSGRALAAKRRW